jgi:hypothetical protein
MSARDRSGKKISPVKFAAALSLNHLVYIARTTYRLAASVVASSCMTDSERPFL